MPKSMAERQQKTRDKLRAQYTLLHVFDDKKSIPRIVEVSLYWQSIELGICHKNHLEEANLSDQWLNAYEERLIQLFPEVEDEPVVALEFELYVLGDAHRYADKKCNTLTEESN